MLYQTGYLTIADYSQGLYQLRVPDEEVKRDIAALLAGAWGWSCPARMTPLRLMGPTKGREGQSQDQIFNRCFLSAMPTASERFAAPSFAKISRRCFLTPTSEMPNCLAMSLLA